MQRIIPMVDQMLAEGIGGPVRLDPNWFHWAARHAHGQHRGTKHTLNLAQAYLQELYDEGKLDRNSQKRWVKVDTRRMSNEQRRALHLRRLARKPRQRRVTPALGQLRLLESLGALEQYDSIAA